LLDEENRKLKQLAADLSLDKAMLQEAVTKSSEACRIDVAPGVFLHIQGA